MRVGIAGLRRGRALLRVLAERQDVTVTALCDPDRSRLEDAADTFGVQGRFSGFEDLLESRPEAVVIATPAPLHADQAIAALEAGCHVLSEVPAAWSLEECERLSAAVGRSSAVYMLAENMCYFHYIQDWKRRVADGEIGDVFYAEAEYVHDCRKLMEKDGWRARMPPIHYCTHSLGPLLDILGDRCVSAVGMDTGCHTAPDLGVTDMEVALFQTSAGRVLKVLCGFSVSREPSFHWQVFYGTRGSLENRRGPTDSAKLYREDTGDTVLLSAPVEDPQAPPEARGGGHGTSEYFMVDDFVKSARGECPPSIGVEFALAMTAPGICAHLSTLGGGDPVAVPQF